MITTIACMSASGHYVSPMVIFPSNNMAQALMRGYPDGAVCRAHSSGWVQNNQLAETLIYRENKTAERPIILALDGHYSQGRNPDVIDMTTAIM